MKATNKELEIINKRYNDLFDDPCVGLDYVSEGVEIDDFEVDDNGRVTITFTRWYLNNQYALRSREYIRHPRIKKDDLDYLLGRTNEC